MDKRSGTALRSNKEAVCKCGGGKGTVLVEFLDNGERVTTSFRALRRFGK